MMSKTKKELASLTCVPCRGGTPPMEGEKIKLMLDAVPDWTKSAGDIDKIEKLFKFKDFKEAMNFVNKVAEIAEEQDHHPDIFVQWNKVTLTLWTHAINGLFENDFIVAAKIDEI
ncbi:MAG: putative pterin-4-alpha-carbinolamine dehydratase [Candidatus Thorarchaeota archaeon AB_25]|nr:MAG: putative pterin-4-alpha-carbinolamine dehydratase [Candidatus Thorarchaeota archaeon AB_25]